MSRGLSVSDQYSLGRSIVVTDRSASVIIQSVSVSKMLDLSVEDDQTWGTQYPEMTKSREIIALPYSSNAKR